MCYGDSYGDSTPGSEWLRSFHNAVQTVNKDINSFPDRLEKLKYWVDLFLVTSLMNLLPLSKHHFYVGQYNPTIRLGLVQSSNYTSY